jgi:hypothetical protein
MVEHRSPKPSMGVRIPHPLDEESHADSNCMAFIFAYIFHVGKLRRVNVRCPMGIIIQTVWRKNEAMRDEKNDSNCNKVRWYPV